MQIAADHQDDNDFLKEIGSSVEIELQKQAHTWSNYTFLYDYQFYYIANTISM